MNTYAGVEVYTHAFLIFTLNRNEWVSFTHQKAYQWGQTWMTGGRMYPIPISTMQSMENLCQLLGIEPGILARVHSLY